MAGIEYVVPVWPAQGVIEPMIGSGIGGLAVVGVTLSSFLGLSPHPLEAMTEMVPLVLPAVTVMEGVPCPAVIAHPLGTVQV
jgi:hypothetical protein